MDSATGNFLLAHAADGDWEALTRDCIGQLGNVTKDGTALGILYVTDMLDSYLERICEKLRDATGVEDWIGTVGLGICVPRTEYFERPAMAVMVGQFTEDSFRVLPPIIRPGQKLPGDLPDWVAQCKPTLGVIHADPRNAYVPSIILSITDDTDAYLVGGLTASRGEFPQIAGVATESGVSGALFSGEVAVVTGLTQGCSPIGDVHDVTASRDNVVLTLDGRPALDVFKEDIGEVLSRNLNRVGGYIHAALPIADSDLGDYLVRNLTGIDPEGGAMSFGERLSPGDRVMFVRRDTPSAEKDLARMLDDVTGRAASAPKAALYYSCLARGPNQFGSHSEELKAVSDAIGDIPLIGFFANGEICNNRIYSYTGVLTLFL